MLYLLLFLTVFAHAEQCDVIKAEKIATKTFGQTKACIKSLAYAPTTPEFPRLYFQKLGNKVDFTLFCHGDKEFLRVLFLEDDGIQSLKLPVYYYMSGIDHTDLPRNVLHFKHQNKDLYLEFEYYDVANVLTADKLPEISEKMMVSMNRIQNEYIKKYETWLKSKKMDSAIHLTSPDEAETAILMTCLEKKQQEVVKTYLQNKYQAKFPAYGDMVDDWNNHRRNPTPEIRAKYQRPWGEMEAEFKADIGKFHPDCDGVVSEASINEALEKSFGQSKKVYEDFRKRLHP